MQRVTEMWGIFNLNNSQLMNSWNTEQTLIFCGRRYRQSDNIYRPANMLAPTHYWGQHTGMSFVRLQNYWQLGPKPHRWVNFTSKGLWWNCPAAAIFVFISVARILDFRVEHYRSSFSFVSWFLDIDNRTVWRREGKPIGRNVRSVLLDRYTLLININEWDIL